MTGAAPTDLSTLSTADIPLALFDLHHEMRVGQSATVDLPALKPNDRTALIEGAGFSTAASTTDQHVLRRERTLADTTAPRLRLLMAGLNPSLTAADLGYGFASPSNRFWKAAVTSGLVTRPRDPRSIAVIDRVGMTDLVKRATPKAADVNRDEFVAGVARLERIARLFQPGVICVAGVRGWRAATGGPAALGRQPDLLGGCPVYVMPNPSGLNAHTNHDDLVRHFTAALDIEE